MKFLCPSCKAKYQIADEKIIGRTVKMKCRQCGYLIEISEALMERASLPGPAMVVTPSAAPPSVSPRSVAPAAVVQPPSPSPLRAAPPKPGRKETPPAGSPVVRTALEPSAKPAVVQPKATSVGGVPRPQGAVVPRPVRPTGGEIAPPSTRALPRSPHSSDEHKVPPHAAPIAEHKVPPHAAPIAEHKVPPHAAPIVERKVPPHAAPASERKHPFEPLGTSRSGAGGLSTSGGDGRLPGVSAGVASSLGASARTTKKDPLAGAFTKAVEQAAPESVEHPLAGDEWYVGVGEQPLGPIRLAEIRDRAAKGEITPECLVWRDGFEDWRPLTAFPELVAVVEEGIASARSMMPPAVSPSIEPFTLRQIAAAPGQPSNPQGQLLEHGLRPNAPARIGFAGETEAQSSNYVAQGQGRREPAQFDLESLEAAGLAKPKIPLAAWAAVMMALVLGVTIGIVVIKPEPPKQIIKYVEVPAKQAQVATDSVVAVASGAVVAAPDVVADGRPQSGGNGRKAVQSSGSVSEPAAVASVAAPQGLKGLSGLRGLGPQGGPAPDGAAVSGGASQLDSATLTKTVSRYTPSVKRSCWQPALDMRTPDAPTSARVTATITVGANGRVQNVSTSGDPRGYRGLASCIQTRVRSWEFPPSGGTTEFNVPFVFAAQ